MILEQNKDVYVMHPSLWHKMYAYGTPIEKGICDWWYDVRTEYPYETIFFWPEEMESDGDIGLTPETIYRGVRYLDEAPAVLCHYMVLKMDKEFA